MRYLWIVLVVFSSVVFAGPIFKCVDEEGVTNYSNDSTCGSGPAEQMSVKQDFKPNEAPYDAHDVNQYYLKKWRDEENMERAAKRAEVERQRQAYEERKARKRARMRRQLHCRPDGIGEGGMYCQ